MKCIYNQVLTDYKHVMTNYMKGTGGGDGDSASYCIWEEREDTNILRYHNNSTSQYLTWVFMYDKQFQFVLSKRKGPLPIGIALDDNMCVADTKTFNTPARGSNSGRNTPTSNILANELKRNR